jgi:ribosomal protein S18 acetylase RimI-like enzyme
MKDERIRIKEINRFSVRIFDAVSRLLPQLASGSESLTKERFKKILKSEATHFFIAEHRNNIAGMMTIAVYDIPTATRAWIEDVVVDESQRGLGFGKEMLNFAIRFAGSTGAKTVDLTSRPFRIAANQLYQKSGFAIRETNVYRYQLKQ